MSNIKYKKENAHNTADEHTQLKKKIFITENHIYSLLNKALRENPQLTGDKYHQLLSKKETDD